MPDPYHEYLRLQSEREQTRLDLIKTNLKLYLTFATAAETAYSVGNRHHAERTLATVEKGYSDTFQFFSQATEINSEMERELWSRFRQLRERLDGLKRLGKSGPR